MADLPPSVPDRPINIGFGLERLGLLSLAFPTLTTLLVVAATLAGLAGLAQLRFDENLGAALDIQSPRFQQLRQFSSKYTVSDTDIILVLEADRFSRPDAYHGLRDIVLSAGTVESVRQVVSIFSLRNAQAGEIGERVLPETANHPDLEARLNAVRTHPLNQGKYLSADQTTAAIVVRLHPPRDRSLSIRQTLAELDVELRPIAASAGLTLLVTGNPSLRATVIDFLIIDQLVNNIGGLLIGFAASLIVLRSLLSALHNIIPPALALIWVLGGMGLIGVPINAITIVLPVLILVLAFCDSMHMTFDWQKNVENGALRDTAIAGTIRRIGPACALTSLTTAIAFSTLMLTDARPIFELGRAGSLATMVAFLSVILVNPLIARWRHKTGRLPKSTRAYAPMILRGAAALTAIPVRFRRPVVALSLGATVMCTIILFSLDRSYSFLENVPRGSESYRALNLLQDKLGGFEPVQLQVTTPKGELDDPAAWAAMRELHAQLAAQLPGAQVFSLVSFANWLFPQNQTISPDKVATSLQQIAPAFTRRWLATDLNAAVITIFIQDTASLDVRQRLVEIQEIAGKIDPEQLSVAEPTGILAVSQYEAVAVINRLLMGLVVAMLACLTMIGLATRSWRFALISLVPNLLPIVLTASGLFFAGLGLQFTSAIAFTVAFGIAVDNTIHFLNQFRLQSAGAGGTEVALAQTMERVGPIILATTATLSAGMAVTLFANLPTVALFGLLCVIIFLIALVSDLIILPALLLTYFRRPNS